MRAKTLAEGIPSLSFPAGSNPIGDFDDRNIDLMTLKDNEAWPAVRPTMSLTDTRRRWFHSDTIDVALRYNFPLFNHWLNQGNLK
ncbi:MAG: hypothetical protein JNG86_00120 [Verrucomicrobiaceae bacterium]|nr:hypothetical protein [Verrucomicrobiaceae bacterium]